MEGGGGESKVRDPIPYQRVPWVCDWLKYHRPYHFHPIPHAPTKGACQNWFKSSKEGWELLLIRCYQIGNALQPGVPQRKLAPLQGTLHS